VSGLPEEVPVHRLVEVGSIVITAGIAAVAVAIPAMNPFSLFVAALVGTQVIAALSLNVLMGYAGQVSLGQAAFVGVGAYSAAQLAEWLPFPLPIVGAVVVSAAVAALVGLPSLRIKGLQVAATTLAFGVAAGGVLFARPWSSSSASGMALARPSELSSGRTFAFVVWGALAAVVVFDMALRRGRLGRAFTAVRDREENAAAWGIAVGRTKLMAYAVSGAYAGVAGALYAYLLQRVTPGPFDVWASLGLVAAVVIGGRGSVAGVALAEGALSAGPELLRSLQVWAPFVGAVALIAVPVLRPEGLSQLLDRPFLLPRRGTIGWRRSALPARPPVDTSTGSVPASAPATRQASLGTGLRPLQLSIPMRSVLEVSDLRVRFGGVEALSGVDLRVGRNQTVGLIGPNGAGKTTVFNAVSGLVRPEEGRIRYRGIDLLGLPSHARQGLGLARTFQQVGLCLTQSVESNVLIAQHPYATAGRLGTLATLRAPQPVDVRGRAEKALALVGLEDLAGARVADLPHVTQRLVELAAALASGPELVLLDEPASGLSPEEAVAFVERVRHLRRTLGLTLLLIEHHLPVVTQLADFVYVLAEGQVLASGTPEQVQRDERVIASYLGGADTSGMRRVG
jgi:branched-chain amino acid transport system permease protein